ncbi:hypothetical protein ES332_D02G085900v1 [Gossypium tomentosum]|uniref:Uncharacterized protein n=1 Tax=Gossypium tomentosum TaxID=34277 RepID=A0A5D2LUR1_GOSTO|nr:hypothetical protein ES332_D02G085900v1 [Gossypium tomentosum]
MLSTLPISPFLFSRKAHLKPSTILQNLIVTNKARPFDSENTIQLRWPWPTVAWWCSAQVGKWASGGRWLGLVGLGFLNAELRLMGWGSWASSLLFGLFCWYGPGKFGLLHTWLD